MRPQDVEHLSTKPLNWDELWDEDEQRYRVKTRDGDPVRVYTANGADSHRPVIGEYNDGLDGEWVLVRWRKDGRFMDSGSGPLDLIPEPRKVKRWANVYKDPLARRDSYTFNNTFPYESKEVAEDHISDISNYIATVPVEWEE